MKQVYLVHGYLASNLRIRSNDYKVWWEPSVSMLLGVGALRLSPDGFTPQPPDGQLLYVDQAGQEPWPTIKLFLSLQLNPSVWSIQLFSWDWRQDILLAAAMLADRIRQQASLTEPATIVGHSAGGLVAMLAYGKLAATNQTNLVRRIITIGTPFQGSYLPIQWANGLGEAISQLTVLRANPVAALAGDKLAFTLAFLANLAFTWPTHYQLYPAFTGQEAQGDPNRKLLYDATNYGRGYAVRQASLDASKNVFQTALNDPATFPPAWVATYVYGTGIDTPSELLTKDFPLNLTALGSTNFGDGVVTHFSAIRRPGPNKGFPASHSNLPFGITASGDMAKMILDPRGPPDPTPPDILGTIPVGISITAPPISDPENGVVCLGGG